MTSPLPPTASRSAAPRIPGGSPALPHLHAEGSDVAAARLPVPLSHEDEGVLRDVHALVDMPMRLAPATTAAGAFRVLSGLDPHEPRVQDAMARLIAACCERAECEIAMGQRFGGAQFLDLIAQKARFIPPQPQLLETLLALVSRCLALTNRTMAMGCGPACADAVRAATALHARLPDAYKLRLEAHIADFVRAACVLRPATQAHRAALADGAAALADPAPEGALIKSWFHGVLVSSCDEAVALISDPQVRSALQFDLAGAYLLGRLQITLTHGQNRMLGEAAASLLRQASAAAADTAAAGPLALEAAVGRLLQLQEALLKARPGEEYRLYGMDLVNGAAWLCERHPALRPRLPVLSALLFRQADDCVHFSGRVKGYEMGIGYADAQQGREAFARLLRMAIARESAGLQVAWESKIAVLSFHVDATESEALQVEGGEPIAYPAWLVALRKDLMGFWEAQPANTDADRARIAAMHAQFTANAAAVQQFHGGADAMVRLADLVHTLAGRPVRVADWERLQTFLDHLQVQRASERLRGARP